MIHRESGVFKTSYLADMAVFPLPIAQWTMVALTVMFVAVVPLTFSEYHLSILNLIMIAVVGALGLNILVGYTGQISIGHGALMSVGAYTAANLITRLNAPFWVALPAGGAMAAAIGAVIGVPSLRIKGLYLAIATLAGQFIIEWVINHVPWISGGVQASIEVPRPSVFGLPLKTQAQLYFFLLFFTVLAIAATINLMRSRIGRAFIAIRDQDIAAEIIGIDIFRYKLLAFAVSSFYAGVTGVLYTYYLGIANYEQFQIGVSIDYLAMIIIGGLGSVLGSIFGAIFVTLLPIATRWTLEGFGRPTILAGGSRQYHPKPAPGHIRHADHRIPCARAGRAQSPLAQHARLLPVLAVFPLNIQTREENNENKLDDNRLHGRNSHRHIGGRAGDERTAGDRDRGTMRPYRTDADHWRQPVPGIPRLHQSGELAGWS